MDLFEIPSNCGMYKATLFMKKSVNFVYFRKLICSRWINKNIHFVVISFRDQLTLLTKIHWKLILNQHLDLKTEFLRFHGEYKITEFLTSIRFFLTTKSQWVLHAPLHWRKGKGRWRREKREWKERRENGRGMIKHNIVHWMLDRVLPDIIVRHRWIAVNYPLSPTG